MESISLGRYEIVIPGRPIVLKRPRFSKNGCVYNSQKNEMLISFLDIKNQWGRNPLLINPIHVDIVFIFKISPFYSALKQRTLKNSFHGKRPDIDNLIKYALEVMMNVCYNDDSIVASIAAKKVYGKEDKTIINIREL